MTDTRERWALILGASSGMGEATARALAVAGDNICGIHLDFRAALERVEAVKSDLAGLGRQVLFINMNAADDEKRAAALDRLEERFAAARAAGREVLLRAVDARLGQARLRDGEGVLQFVLARAGGHRSLQRILRRGGQRQQQGEERQGARHQTSSQRLRRIHSPHRNRSASASDKIQTGTQLHTT